MIIAPVTREPLYVSRLRPRARARCAVAPFPTRSGDWRRWLGRRGKISHSVH
jgi:hypothetical protein